MDEHPQLPLELVIMIFEVAARDHRATAATLCLVSRWVQELVEPILYRVRVLKILTPEETHKYLYSPKSLAFLRCLGILHGPIVMDANPIAHSPLPGVQNFATDSTFYTTDLVITDVEEFHILNSYPSGRILFPRLKRLHYSCTHIPQLGGPRCPVREIISHRELTHLAFSVMEDLRVLLLIATVKEVLTEQKQLEVLYIRLLRSTSLVLRGASDYKLIEVELASIGDPRLVVRRVDIDPGAGVLLDEWEQIALKGESLWDWAQIQVDERKESATRID